MQAIPTTTASKRAVCHEVLRCPLSVRCRRIAKGVLAVRGRVWSALREVSAPGSGVGAAAGDRQRGLLVFGGTVALGYWLAEGDQDDVTTT